MKLLRKTKTAVLFFLFTAAYSNYSMEETFAAPATDPLLASFLFEYPKHDGLNPELLKKIVSLFKTDIFIETGTCEGESVKTALPLFKKIHSIELDITLAARAQEKFKDEPTVTIHQGDSAQILPALLPTVNNERILFWLDGHFSGGNTARGDINTPILQELVCIKNCGIADAIILIDDIRFFQNLAQFPDESAIGYPTFNELIQHIHDINPNYCCALLVDTLLVFPRTENVAVSPLVRGCTLTRALEPTTNVWPEDIKNLFLQATGQERDIMHSAYAWFSHGTFSIQNYLHTYFEMWHTFLKNEGML